MSNNPSPPPVSFVDNPHAPDIFADGVAGWFFLNGNVRITFESARVSHISAPGPLNRVVIGRLVMPVDAAENFAKGLLKFIADQKSAPQQAGPNVQGTPTIQ